MNLFNLPQGAEPHFSRYIKFINSRPKRIYEKFRVNKHHILPRSMNGTEDFSNLIILTHREHYIAHLILWKCYGGAMVTAFWFMQFNASTSGKYNNKINSRQFSILREDYCKICFPASTREACKKVIVGKALWNKGIPLSSEAKRKLSISLSGNKHYNYGKHLSEETRKKISNANKGNTNFLGRHHTQESKEKQRKNKIGKSNPQFGKSPCQKNIDIHSKKVICVETGQVFPSIRSASEYYNLDIHKISLACKHKEKTVLNLHWEYYENRTN
jgi:hypothetical protein